MFASPNMSSVMGAVFIERHGVASALRATFFNVGYTLSFNLVILVMTIGIPYSLVTAVISAANVAVLPLTERVAFGSGLS